MRPVRLRSRAARLAPAAYVLFLGLNTQAAPEDGGRHSTARLAPAFGATVRATYPDGRFRRYWLAPDGTWSGLSRHGKPSAGTWALKAERLCLRQTEPIAPPFGYCTPLPQRLRVGASWPAKDPHGRPIRISLVKGDHGRSAGVQARSGKTP